jgi:hypothetical protein
MPYTKNCGSSKSELSCRRNIYHSQKQEEEETSKSRNEKLPEDEFKIKLEQLFVEAVKNSLTL